MINQCISMLSKTSFQAVQRVRFVFSTLLNAMQVPTS